MKRVGLLVLLSGFPALTLCAQVDSTSSSTVVLQRRQNAWVSAGIGAGMGGVAGMAGAWYSNNHLVVGAHVAGVADWDQDVHDGALLLGVRNLSPNSLIMVAAGPARLGGRMYVGGPYTPRGAGVPYIIRTVARNEIGMAVSAEAILNLSLVGFGLDAFVARSENRLLEGVTLSLQVGWLGN